MWTVEPSYSMYLPTLVQKTGRMCEVLPCLGIALRYLIANNFSKRNTSDILAGITLGRNVPRPLLVSLGSLLA